MSRVLLCGAFGQANPGDDGLLDAFVHALRGQDLVVASPGRVDHAGVSTVPADARGIAVALRDIDAVVVAGGTIFKSLHPTVPRHHLSLLVRTRLLMVGAHARGLPVALVGVGGGDLRSRGAARLARTIADRADLLILRDEESAAVLRGTGATGPFRIGADPAWTVPDLTPPAAAGPRDIVVVALSHLAADDPDRLRSRLHHVVEPLVARGIPVRLQPWQTGADQRLAGDVRDDVGPGVDVDVADRPVTLGDATRSFAGARAVVALRHHALVAAAAAGTPALALAHEPKLAGLARRLGQPWVPSHAAPAVLARSTVELLSHPAPTAAAVANETETAARAMRLLRVVVSGGDDDQDLDRDQLALTTDGAPW